MSVLPRNVETHFTRRRSQLLLWCPKLKRLNAQYLIVSYDNLTNLVAGCPNLEELILGWNPRISENHMGIFFAEAKRLKQFSGRHQTSMTGKFLLKLAPGILESLHIEYFLAPYTRDSYIPRTVSHEIFLQRIQQGIHAEPREHYAPPESALTFNSRGSRSAD